MLAPVDKGSCRQVLGFQNVEVALLTVRIAYGNHISHLSLYLLAKTQVVSPKALLARSGREWVLWYANPTTRLAGSRCAV